MIKYLVLLIFLIVSGHASQYGGEDAPMPFRMGFEFQEESSLCRWAAHQNHLKKKPIFSIGRIGRDEPLFHVEIDDTDLEFVTRPFNPQERDELELTMRLILESLQILKDHLNDRVEISFQDWISMINLNLKSRGLSLTSNMDLTSLGMIRLPDRFLPDRVNAPSEKTVVPYKPRNWRPIFMPQVTIQHPLEETIPLYFSLFGFDNIQLYDFVASLPVLGTYKKILSLNNSQFLERVTAVLRQKISGLIFLHALTLVSLSSDYNENLSASDRDQRDINQTRELWERYMQVDPKIKLALMSRRPFSEMFKNLDGIDDYPSVFKSMMDDNFRFNFDKVPERFKYINYGFNLLKWDGAYEDLDFSLYEPYFNPEFVERNRDNLVYLFHQGVISTTMIRNLRDVITYERSVPVNQIFDSYYAQAIQTVQHPSWTFEIDPNLNLNLNHTKYDVLSPPWFLADQYAMGAMKTVESEDLIYGEAVVEVRSISSVNPWFLRKINQPDSVTGDFLKKPENDMVNQALGLFDYLAHFRSPDNIHDITYLGLPYAVLKN